MVTRDFVELYYKLIHHGFGVNDDAKRMIRSSLKAARDPLAETLMTQERYYYPENNPDIMYEYGIARDQSDEEVRELVHALERHNTSPYDCSGRMVTRWITWKRTPAGIAIVHCLVLDV